MKNHEDLFGNRTRYLPACSENEPPRMRCSANKAAGPIAFPRN